MSLSWWEHDEEPRGHEVMALLENARSDLVALSVALYAAGIRHKGVDLALLQIRESIDRRARQVSAGARPGMLKEGRD